MRGGRHRTFRGQVPRGDWGARRRRGEKCCITLEHISARAREQRIGKKMPKALDSLERIFHHTLNFTRNKSLEIVDRISIGSTHVAIFALFSLNFKERLLYHF